MDDLLDVREVLAYFGLYRQDSWDVEEPLDREAFDAALEELEDMIVGENIEADFDEDGNVVAIPRTGLVEPLFKKHERQVGHRPDNPKHVRAEKERIRAQEARSRQRQDQSRHKLVDRVNERKAKKGK